MPLQPQSVPALVKLRDQIDLSFLGRSKVSDGWIGDAAHRRRFSYHNPDKDNWVHARDFTHDPVHGLDIGRFTDELVSAQDDRILELIANDLYWHYERPRWVEYFGANEHRQHFHITVKPGPWAMDARSWDLPSLRQAPDAPDSGARVLMVGSHGDDVARLQDLLRRAYRSYAGGLIPDGVFGPQTERVVREFQRRSHLVADGVVGPVTRQALGLPDESSSPWFEPARHTA